MPPRRAMKDAAAPPMMSDDDDAFRRADVFDAADEAPPAPS